VPVSNCSALAYYPSPHSGIHNAAPKLRQSRFKYRATPAARRGAPDGLHQPFLPRGGITNFPANGGALEDAQRIAGHADSRTTKLYDRRAERVLPGDMERVRY
jgi:hypothetical protein